MKFFFTITKKSLAIILCVILIAFVTVARVASLKVSAIDGSTHEKRMIYARSLKLCVEEEEITYKETVIPRIFSDVYKSYNELQKEAGFNLSQYKGERVTVYTCPLSGEKRNLTLIVHKGKIIGGDICDISVKGEMKPLL